MTATHVFTTELFHLDPTEFADALQALGIPAPSPGKSLSYRLENVTISVPHEAKATLPGGAPAIAVTVRR